MIIWYIVALKFFYLVLQLNKNFMLEIGERPWGKYFVLEDIRMSFRLKYEDWYIYEQYWGTIIIILNSKGVCDLYCSQKVTNNLGKLIKIDLYKTKR